MPSSAYAGSCDVLTTRLRSVSCLSVNGSRSGSREGTSSVWERTPPDHQAGNLQAFVHNPCMIDRRLHVLRMVAACGTVTGAAEALHYTPSAVSQQLRTLGKDLGVDLVVQDGRGIRLTPAARVLLEHADELFSTWEEIRGEVVAAAAEWHRHAAAVRLLHRRGGAAARAWPRACTPPTRAAGCGSSRPTPRSASTCCSPTRPTWPSWSPPPTIPSTTDPRFEQRHLLEDPLDLLVPETHRLAQEDSVLLGDLVEESWIMDRPGRPVPPAAADRLRRSRLLPGRRAHRHRVGHRGRAGRRRSRDRPDPAARAPADRLPRRPGPAARRPRRPRATSSPASAAAAPSSRSSPSRSPPWPAAPPSATQGCMTDC